MGIYTTFQVAAANANHDAKRAALDLDLLLILSAPLNHPHSWIVGCQVDMGRLSGRHRRQASSHSWIAGVSGR
ncbi:hypothetical protein CDH05_23415 [Pseudomonas lactis]|nr:hypothetical protein CDH05_23415 [Pseudomonas lactis]